MNAIIMNMIERLKSNAKNEIKLVNEISKVPGVDIGTINTMWTPVTRKGCTSKELTVSFKWHGFDIRLENTPQFTTEVFMEDDPIGEIYWDASTGNHRNIYNCTEKIQKNIVDIMERVFFNISVDKSIVVRMHDVLTINECKIMADKAEITYMYPDGRKGMLISKDQFGKMCNSIDTDIYDVMRFVKKNYIVKKCNS